MNSRWSRKSVAHRGCSLTFAPWSWSWKPSLSFVTLRLNFKCVQMAKVFEHSSHNVTLRHLHATTCLEYFEFQFWLRSPMTASCWMWSLSDIGRWITYLDSCYSCRTPRWSSRILVSAQPWLHCTLVKWTSIAYLKLWKLHKLHKQHIPSLPLQICSFSTVFT